MRFGLLGPLLVVDDEGRARAVPAPKQRALLAALLVRANTTVPRDDLVAAVWGAEAPPTALPALRTYAARLRRILGGAGVRIVGDSAGYRVEIREPAELDVCEAEALLRAARAATERAEHRAAALLLRQATGLWRGSPLADVPSDVLRRDELARLEELRLRVLEARIDADLRGGRTEDVEDAVGELRALVAAHPLRERAHYQLMLALYTADRRGEALAAYAAVRRVLRDELGVEPGPRLAELHRRVLAVLPATDEPEGRAAVPAPAPAPAPAPRAAPAVVPAELPPDIADFTGRWSLVKVVEKILAPATGRDGATALPVAVLAGPGGIGKTTLAVHAAHRLRGGFPDGQMFVGLRGTGTDPARPEAVLARLLRGLGVPERSVPADGEERAALYRSTLAGRGVLLVLDDAADAAQVRPLLPGNPRCAVIVTCRGRLAGLDGVSTVEAGVLDPEEADDLFRRVAGEQRAQADEAATTVVLAACAGLPLAIRLAAARLASRPDWSTRTLADRLADERQRLDELRVEDRAVRAGFAVSYASLPPGDPRTGTDPARTFRLLGLAPVADFGLSAAAAMLRRHEDAGHADTDTDAAGEDLGVLVDVHLLESTGAGRYRFHDLLRLYAAERAAAVDGTAARAAALRGLTDWYLHAAAAAANVRYPAERHRGPRLAPTEVAVPDIADDAAAAAWFDLESANLAGVAASAAANGLHRQVVDLALVASRHLYVTGATADAEALHARGLAAARVLHDRPAEARCLQALGLLDARTAHDLPKSVEMLTRAAAIHRACGGTADEGVVLGNLGILLWQLGRYAEAAESHRRSLAIARSVGHRTSEGNALGNLGIVCARLGRHAEALEYLDQSLAVHRETGNRPSEVVVLISSGVTCLRLGRYERSAELLEEGRRLARAIGDRHNESAALRAFGMLRAATGHEQEALRHFREALAFAAEAEVTELEAEIRNGLGEVLRRLGDPQGARREQERGALLAARTGTRYHEALCLAGLALTLRTLGDTEGARRRWERARALYRDLGLPEAAEVEARLAEL